MLVAILVGLDADVGPLVVDIQKAGAYDDPMGIAGYVPDVVQAIFDVDHPTIKAFRSQAKSKLAVWDFIEGQYNPYRWHSSFGFLSSINYKRT